MQTESRHCNFESHQSGYKNLTCEKWTLSQKVVLEKEEAIGWHQVIKTYKCFKCGCNWKVFEEYDSHHGYNYFALKEGKTATVWGKTHSFK